MNFFIMVSLFLSAALGVFRGIDLAFLTDAETGLCIVGSVWLRYGALAVAVLAAGCFFTFVNVIIYSILRFFLRLLQGCS